MSFTIDRDVGIVALAAFVLALISSIYNLYGFLQGPEVELFPPAQVELRDGPYGVVIHAQMAYVNTGRATYNGVVASERVRFTVLSAGGLDREVELAWQSFITTDYSEDGEIRIEQDANPFVVGGRSSEGHQTAFHPRTIRCGDAECDIYANYVEWADFLDGVGAVDSLSFEFVSELHGEDPLTVRCSIFIDEDFVQFARDRRYHSRSCWN